MKKINIFLILTAFVLITNSCKDFLDQDPDRIMSDDEIFSDPIMIKSVLANYYGRLDGKEWGMNINNGDQIYNQSIIDDAAKFEGGPDERSTFEDDRFRTYDYTLIRNVNQFLEGLRATTAVTEKDKRPLEGEARFIRAWVYFNMCRSMGGMPIVNDEIFTYEPGIDVTPMQKPRATESEMYDYIIKECREVANMLSDEKQINSARANKWAAKMLEARAALYAGSLAKYNNKMSSPIKTDDGEVGIPAEKAQSYYETALAAAIEVINSKVYILQDKKPDDKGRNFYEATSVKDNNTEVIWARDYKYPGQTVEFSKINIPKSHAEDIDNSAYGPILNLIEQFEIIETNNPGIGAKIATTENGTYKFYETADAPFKERDPRLWGSVIYPGADFKGKEVVLQAGQLIKENGEWKTLVGDLDSKDSDGKQITAFNGPKESNEQYINKSGFYFRKYMDETTGSATRGKGSEMWWPRFRISEAYLIASEASFELNNNAKATEYINAVRNRAGVKPLESVTFENIVHENRVEFAFEDHRYWDMKRWRLADKVWNGNNNDEMARHRRLWPYRVNAPGDPNDGKWVFIEDFLFMSPNARYFQMKNYYNFLNMDWVNNNPKMVKNPYQ